MWSKGICGSIFTPKETVAPFWCSLGVAMSCANFLYDSPVNGGEGDGKVWNGDRLTVKPYAY